MAEEKGEMVDIIPEGRTGVWTTPPKTSQPKDSWIGKITGRGK